MAKSPAERIKLLRRDCVAVYYAMRDPRMPAAAKIAAFCVVAYALSPVDIIPDFIPVIGYIDDLIIIPLGIYFVIKMIPSELYNECIVRADKTVERPVVKAGFAIALAVWIFLSIAVLLFVRFLLKKNGNAL